MPRELLRLLKSHDFLKSAIQQYGDRLSQDEAADLEIRKDQVFTQIVKYSADDARVTTAQVRFLVTSLVELCAEPKRVADLRKVTDHQLNRLAAQVTAMQPTRSVSADGYRYLHTMRDRVAVLDRQYRYVFTNRANGIFHNEPPEDFVGRANWLMTDETFFEQVTRPIVDTCMQGRSMTVKSLHYRRHPQRAFETEFMPVESESGVIDAVMGICREVPVADVLGHADTVLVP